MCVRGSWRLNKDCNILTSPAPPDIAVCRFRSPGLLNRGPSLSATCSDSSIFTPTGLQTHWGSGGPLLPGDGFLYHILSPTSLLQLTYFLSFQSYIIVQSPTQSLEWHVWSSSSGNNCHAVHRSLSSGASVYECTMRFYLVPYFSQARLLDFFS